jgi:hypothetical protein
MNKETLRMQMLAGIITEGQYKAKLNENMDNWGNEPDDSGRNERDYKPKPSLADFNYNKEEYKKYMKEFFPGEQVDIDDEQVDIDDEQVDIDESFKLYQEGDNIFNIIDKKIIEPDQDSNYFNGTTKDRDKTNYGIGFSTNLSKNKEGKLDYTDEQKQNFINYLKKRVKEKNEDAIKLYKIAQTDPESKDFI